MQWASDNWPVLLVVLLFLAILAFVLLRPRQRVRLDNSQTPLRPHMAAAPPTGERRGITDEAAAAACDVTGQIIGAPVHAHLPGASGPPDDLQRLKGVGPKLAGMLNELGITRFDHLAGLSEGDLDQLDGQLGAFRGRLRRDQVPQQADYLARGDQDGFERRFGKL
jgi:predicted flap endonuclease-1-like 5' DNA nuclease